MKMNIFCLVLILVVPVSVFSSDRDLVIRHGIFFGECAGYCVSEIEVSGSEVKYKATYLGPPQQSMPAEKNAKNSITREVWNNLLHLVKEPEFMNLKNRYGCPDCADQGGEWVEIMFTDGNKKKVTFDYNRPPKEILNLASKLQDIQRSFKDTPGVLGSAGPIPSKPTPR